MAWVQSPLPPLSANYHCNRAHSIHKGGHFCFISYRVATDQELTVAFRAHAEATFRRWGAPQHGVWHDVQCLKCGSPWQEGFLSGLRAPDVSLVVIFLSVDALKRFSTADRMADNFLLEIEHALHRRDRGELDLFFVLGGKLADNSTPRVSDVWPANLPHRPMHHVPQYSYGACIDGRMRMHNILRCSVVVYLHRK